jgi:hypothetical protein
MHHDFRYSQAPDFDKELPWCQRVRFDSERISLEGHYSDELSAYRARRNWIEAFENSFLLDIGHDYNLSTSSNLEEGKFVLKCDFMSACGRYAFWRLINNQAPDVQYLIETAHIPNAESSHEAFVAAPDLTSVGEQSLLLSATMRRDCQPTVLTRIRRFINRFCSAR